jgi:hypothetical protein
MGAKMVKITIQFLQQSFNVAKAEKLCPPKR